MIQIDIEDHPIIAEERRAILLKLLNENGYIQAAELAEKLNITAITIRRDLSMLEAEGLCVRKRGGAVRSLQSVTLELPYQIKQHSFIAEKKRIAEEAVKLVEPGSTIILNSGSTTYALALLLSQKENHGSNQRFTNCGQACLKPEYQSDLHGGSSAAKRFFTARLPGRSFYS